MKFCKLSVILIFFSTLLLQSNVMAEVQEITIKNTRELAVGYSERYFRDFPVAAPGAGHFDENGYAGIVRLYESFTLPAYDPSYILSSATLNFSYKSATAFGGLQILGTQGGWTDFNWYRQPQPTTGVLGVIPPSPAVWTDGKIDVTDYINNAYKAGNLVGFVFRSSRENSNITDIADFRPGQTLNLTFTSPIPEPENYVMLLMGLGLIGFIARRKFR